MESGPVANWLVD